MLLNVNSPAYFSQEYGVDDEVYWMCREIFKFMKDKTYSEKIDTVGIIPIVAPIEIIEKGLWKEEVRFDMKFKQVYISRQIDYDKYRISDTDGKKKLIIKNILDSVKIIECKAKFNYIKFEQDLLNFLKCEKANLF